MKVLWYWYAMGPYHFARMNALARQRGIELTVVESTRYDDHAWNRSEEPHFHLVTLSSEPFSRDVLRKTSEPFSAVLQDVRPDVVVAPGYADPYTLRTLSHYRAQKRESLLMLWNESTAVDNLRHWTSERFKSIVLTWFDGALVAGSPHARYLKRLGMSESRVGIVGNCVDNDYFSRAAAAIRRENSATGLGRDGFLYVGRLIPPKNLKGLLESYRLYREDARTAAWDLIIVGAGIEEAGLRLTASHIAPDSIHFAGLQQSSELPGYYARAGCLILPSTSEPWGLVVNEAMASGLPILVSNRCGCAEDLVRDGKNGFVFDPEDHQGIARLMKHVSSGAAPLQEMAQTGQEIISEYSPDRFAQRAVCHIVGLRTDGVLARSSHEASGASRAAASFLTSIWRYVA